MKDISYQQPTANSQQPLSQDAFCVQFCSNSAEVAKWETDASQQPFKPILGILTNPFTYYNFLLFISRNNIGAPKLTIGIQNVFLRITRFILRIQRMMFSVQNIIPDTPIFKFGMPKVNFGVQVINLLIRGNNYGVQNIVPETPILHLKSAIFNPTIQRSKCFTKDIHPKSIFNF